MRESGTGVREISVEEFDEMIENHDDLLIVDVRDEGEYDKGHIPGARLVPYATLDRKMLDDLTGAQDKTLVLYSEMGRRSAWASEKFREKGFEKVYSLAGGISLWKAQGFALVGKD